MNRVHLDLNLGGGHRTRRRVAVYLAAAQTRFVAAGALVIGPVESRGEYWIVLADPERNEFWIQ